MKKLKLFEINDGLDGIIVAKSLKQAIKLLAVYYRPYKVHEFIDSIKKCEKNFLYQGDFTLTGLDKVAKKGNYKKSKVIGWCQY